MKNRPYRFSKKAGRYISSSQTGNREYYHKILASIEPNADFDPNSTYGKHILKKTISDLKNYKRTIQDNKNLQNALSSMQKRLNELQIENKREEAFRRNKAIREGAATIVVQNYPLIAFIKKNSFFISLVLTAVTYATINKFQILFWIFIGIYISLTIIGNLIFNQLLKLNLYQVENELKNSDFGQDLRGNEDKIQDEINQAKNEIEKLKNRLQVCELEISLKIQKFLNDDKLKFILSDQFYNSTDWRKIRAQAIATLENVCVMCGNVENLCVDHIYPRSKFPEKALEISNTQILCLRCNCLKGNRINQ